MTSAESQHDTCDCHLVESGAPSIDPREIITRRALRPLAPRQLFMTGPVNTTRSVTAMVKTTGHAPGAAVVPPPANPAIDLHKAADGTSAPETVRAN
jgi:hypothetical protein